MTTKKVERRIKIKFRIRKSVNGTAERPRLSVFRSNKQIYAQVINDLTGTTLVSASSLGLEKLAKIDQAKKVGELVAEKAKAAGIESVVFDRNGYLYHEAPQIPNYGSKGNGVMLKAGMCIAIEPMITMGDHNIWMLPDKWSIITRDRKPAAHFEHTIAIRKGQAEILSTFEEIENH